VLGVAGGRASGRALSHAGIVGYGCGRFEFPAEHRCGRRTYERAGGWMDNGRKLLGIGDKHFLLRISRDKNASNHHAYNEA
jgi:hypothetical protein